MSELATGDERGEIAVGARVWVVPCKGAGLVLKRDRATFDACGRCMVRLNSGWVVYASPQEIEVVG